MGNTDGNRKQGGGLTNASQDAVRAELLETCKDLTRGLVTLEADEVRDQASLSEKRTYQHILPSRPTREQCTYNVRGSHGGTAEDGSLVVATANVRREDVVARREDVDARAIVAV